MEPTPSTSRPFKAFGSPRMKRKMSHFSENEKVMIINVFKYVMETWPADKYRSQQEMKDKTADILGISKSAVYRVLKEYVQTDTVKPAALPKKRLSGIEKIDSPSNTWNQATRERGKVVKEIMPRVSKKKKSQRGWVFVGPVKEEPVTNNPADVKGLVKEEPVTNNPADVKDEPDWESGSEEAPQVEFGDEAEKDRFCMDIEIKQEIEVGPVQLQPQDIHYSFNKDKLIKAESLIKQEPSQDPFEGC